MRKKTNVGKTMYIINHPFGNAKHATFKNMAITGGLLFDPHGLLDFPAILDSSDVMWCDVMWCDLCMYIHIKKYLCICMWLSKCEKWILSRNNMIIWESSPLGIPTHLPSPQLWSWARVPHEQKNRRPGVFIPNPNGNIKSQETPWEMNVHDCKLRFISVFGGFQTSVLFVPPFEAAIHWAEDHLWAVLCHLVLAALRMFVGHDACGTSSCDHRSLIYSVGSRLPTTKPWNWPRSSLMGWTCRQWDGASRSEVILSLAMSDTTNTIEASFCVLTK